MIRTAIVDDESVIRNGIADLVDWQALGCEVVLRCQNGQKLLAALRQTDIQLCVTDIKMPLMDGLTLLKHLKHDHQEVEVIMLTAHAEFAMAQDALRGGAADYVNKNDFLSELPSAVTRAVESLKRKSVETDIRNRQAAQMRMYIFERLLQGLAVVDADILHYGLDGGSYLVCFCQLGLGNAAHPQQQRLQNHLITNLKPFSPMLIQERGNPFYVLLHWGCAQASGIQEVLAAFNDTIRTVKEIMNLAIHVGISELATDPRTLIELRAEANYALFLSGENEYAIRLFERAETRKATRAELHLAVTRVVEAAYANQWADARARLADYRNIALIAGLGLETVRASAIDLASALLRHTTAENPADEAQSTEDELLASISRYTMLEQCIRFIDDTLNRMETSSVKPKLHYLVLAMDQYIAKHFCEDISLQSIADAVNISVSYASRLYKMKKRVSITSAINALRIAEAKKYLQNSSLKIYEVAEKVGIHDAGYFTNLFIKSTGMSPSEYRGL